MDLENGNATPQGKAPLVGRLLGRFAPLIALVAACWLVFVFNNLLGHGNLNRYGIIPRHLSSLPGIFWAPFLHESFRHLAANTPPLLVLGGILCARGRREFIVLTLGGIVMGGGLTWLVGRNACHIGASGLVFCFFGYLASLAYFRRTFGTLLLSLACVLGYGEMLRGVLPSTAAVSWEGHLAGLAVGIGLGWLAARAGKVATSPGEDSGIHPGSSGRESANFVNARE